MKPDALPRRLLLTLKLGEVPEHLPGLRAVHGFGTPPADHVDGGIIDRILRHHGGAIRAARLHSARVRRAERNVTGSRRFDDTEQLSGVARVLRIEVREAGRMPALLAALAELPMVERVGPDHLCHAPFQAATRTAGAMIPPAGLVLGCTLKLICVGTALGVMLNAPLVRERPPASARSR